MTYDIYPAVDESYNFPPEVRGALAGSLELRNTVVPMDQTARNNLAVADVWDGRLILNTTTDRINRYNAATQTWVTIAEQSDAILYFTEAERDNLAGTELWDGRLILNTTTRRINRYDLPTTSWIAIVEPADLHLALTSTVTPSYNAGSGDIGDSEEAARADHSHPGSSSPQTDVFTTSGTWTKPVGASQIEVHVLSGGGGGANGTSTSENSGGGGGGGTIVHTFDASSLPATVPITVGAGGIGLTGTSDGNGASGGASSFGTYVVSSGGLGGVVAINGTGNAAGGGVGFYYGGGAGGSYNDGPNTCTPGSPSVEGGGGGGVGGYPIIINGQTSPGSSVSFGAGGAGGYRAAGSNGVVPGGGGGGGYRGAGNGARGEVRIISRF